MPKPADGSGCRFGNGSVDRSNDWLSSGNCSVTKFWDDVEHENDWRMDKERPLSQESTFENGIDGTESFDLFEATQESSFDKNFDKDERVVLKEDRKGQFGIVRKCGINGYCLTGMQNNLLPNKDRIVPKTGSFERYYLHKFKPLACSTPKSKSGVLKMKEELFMSSQVKVLDKSRDLMLSFIDSQNDNPGTESNRLNREGILANLNKYVMKNVKIEISDSDEFNTALVNCNVKTEILEPNECNDDRLSSSDYRLQLIETPTDFLQNQQVEDGVLDVGFNNIFSTTMFRCDVEVFDKSIDNSTQKNLAIFKVRDSMCTKELRRKELIEKIEKIVYDLIEQIVNGQDVQLHLPIRIIQWSNTHLKNDRLEKLHVDLENRTTIKCNKRFSIIMFVLGEVYKLLRSRSGVNRRELYYRCVELCQRRPKKMDFAITDVCLLLSCAPWELGIFASSKGLLSGPMIIVTEEDEVLDSNNLLGEGMALPNNVVNIKTMTTTAKFVLVIEKDTVYKRLIRDDVFNRIGENFLLITACGNPDINTRLFLKRIQTENQIPILGLFDGDPWGIDIYFTYKYGSKEWIRNAEDLAITKLKWIGVHPSEMKSLGLKPMPLSCFDKNKIKSIMNRPYLTDEIAHEVQILENCGGKVEIEAIYDLSDNYFIDVYLAEKIRSHLSTQATGD